MALRMAFVILLWLTGLSPVSLECMICPKGVMNSETMAKFYIFCQRLKKVASKSPVSRDATYPVVVLGVDAQHVDNINLRLSDPPPLVHLRGAEVMRGVDVAVAPATRHLLEVVVANLLLLERIEHRALADSSVTCSAQGVLRHESPSSVDRRFLIVEAQEAVGIRDWSSGLYFEVSAACISG